jgi:hypothetical protein
LLEGPGALTDLKTRFATHGSQGVAAFDQLHEAMKIGLAQGIQNVFLCCLGMMLLAFVTVWFLKELPLRSKKRRQDSTPPRLGGTSGQSTCCERSQSCVSGRIRKTTLEKDNTNRTQLRVRVEVHDASNGKRKP